MERDRDLRRMAEQQHGLVTRHDARGVLGRWVLERMIRDGVWEPATPRVLRLVGAPRTAEQAILAAVFDGGAGALASLDSAARLWRLPGAFPGLEVSRLRGTRGPLLHSGVLHRPRNLSESHVTVVSGIPVTTMARTLFDLAGRLHPARTERLVDSVVARSAGTLASLHQLLDEIGRRGRPGVAVMRALLEERPTGYSAPESGIEARLQRALREHGEPPLQRQLDVGGHEWLGRVDFADVAVGLLVEVDSALHHTSPTDVEADRRRDLLLLEAGWKQVLRLAEELIWHRPHDAVAAVREARRRLRRSAA